jgi:hypothetical protein
MGLDFCKRTKENCEKELDPDNDPHWSYGGFDRFRRHIAKSIGIDLDVMLGFGGDRSWENKNPVEMLLNHSDCDGELSSKECEEIAPELEKIILTWKEESKEEEYDITVGLLLVAAMRECVREGADLIFC